MLFILPTANDKEQSIQNRIYAAAKGHMCAPPHLSQVPPMLSLKQFQCLSDQQMPFLAISREIIKHFLFLHASPLRNWWCDVLGSVCIKFLNTSDLLRCKPFVTVTLPTSLFARSFPLIPASPGRYTHKSFRSWMQNIDTHKSGLLTSFSTFHKKVTEDEILCLMECVVRQNIVMFLALLKTCRCY